LSFSIKGGGVRVWPKETGLGPVAAGLHGFKPHPPHHYVEIGGGSSKGLVLAFWEDLIAARAEKSTKTAIFT
jgi:hypothetical protein